MTDPLFQELLDLNQEAIDLDAHILRGVIAGDVESRIADWVKREDAKYGLKYGDGEADGSAGNGSGGSRSQDAEIQP